MTQQSQDEGAVRLSHQTLIMIITTVAALSSIYVNVSEKLSALVEKSSAQEEIIRELKSSNQKTLEAITELKTKVIELQSKVDHKNGGSK